MNIQMAQEALRAKRESGEIERLDPLEKSARNPQSLAAAVNAMCWECVGRNADSDARREIAHCTGWGCPIWELRPFQHLAPGGYGKEQRHNAITPCLNDTNSSLAAAYRRPESRRKGIDAKCVECMGGDRKLIAGCKSVFPRENFGLDTPTGYRGCPLWPHRPSSGEVMAFKGTQNQFKNGEQA